jgi:hypothetical protein
MLRRVKRFGTWGGLQKGQGLVEYGLIIMLAGVAVILVLTMFGDRVKKFYCEAVLSIAPDIDAPACEGIFVSCNVLSSSPFRLEASVTDSIGDSDIKQVQFYVDGAPYNKEVHYRYCLQGGDSACEAYNVKGKHKFSAVATDAEGNTGTCSVTATVN